MQTLRGYLAEATLWRLRAEVASSPDMFEECTTLAEVWDQLAESRKQLMLLKHRANWG